MLKGCKNYFCMYGILLYSINAILLSRSVKMKKLLRDISKMLSSFHAKILLKPISCNQIYQKGKNYE